MLTRKDRAALVRNGRTALRLARSGKHNPLALGVAAGFYVRIKQLLRDDRRARQQSTEGGENG